MTSEENDCGLVSVQPLECPVALTEEEIVSSGSWQTMLRLSAYNIKAEDHPNGFFMTFLTLKDNSMCGNETMPNRLRFKSFTYEVMSQITSKDIVAEITLTFIIVLLISAIISFLFIYILRPKGSYSIR